MFTTLQTHNRSDTDIRDAATLRQQRRLKQTIQFIHKDSADLLPLDGLKKLGTSKEGQPHNILQRRLLEAKLSQGRLNLCGVTPKPGEVFLNHTHLIRSNADDSGEEEDFIYVPCKCSGQELRLLIDTGCRFNLMSSLTVERLGLNERVNSNKEEMGGFPFQRRLRTTGHIEEVSLTIGEIRTECSFAIVESNRPLISLGNKVLKSLKCVIDTEKQMLVLGKITREQVQFAK